MCALLSNAFVRKQSKATSLLSSTEGLKKSANQSQENLPSFIFACLLEFPLRVCYHKLFTDGVKATTMSVMFLFLIFFFKYLCVT